MEIEELKLIFESNWALNYSGESEFLKNISWEHFLEGANVVMIRHLNTLALPKELAQDDL